MVLYVDVLIGRAATMPKKKTPYLDPEEQFKRFQEAAKAAEADESGKSFERSFLSIARSKPPKKRKG